MKADTQNSGEMTEQKMRMRFYREQLRRYHWPIVGLLLLDFTLLFLWTEFLPEFSGRLSIIAALSGSLGGFVRFMVAERISFGTLHDTAMMFRYRTSLIVGMVLGFFSYLFLIDARLLKIVYPSVNVTPGSEPSAVSAAIVGGIAGLFVEQLVSSAQRRFQQSSSPVDEK